MKVDEASTPILNGEEWLHYIDNTESIDEIPAALGNTPFYKASLTTLGAPTSVGKTAWGLQTFRWLTEQGEDVNYCTLEMSPPQLFKRFSPQFGGMEECREWIKYYDAHITHSYLDYKEVEQVIREGYDFVIIDHIHELPFDGHEDLGRKVHRIASLAPETGTTIIMLSQMKQKDPEFYGPPDLYDYSWTKAIPEVSSVCQAIWKPDPEEQEYQLVTMKNRFAPLDPPLTMQLDKETVTFRPSI